LDLSPTIYKDLKRLTIFSFFSGCIGNVFFSVEKLEHSIRGSTNFFLIAIKKYRKHIGVSLFTPFCGKSLSTRIMMGI